MTWAALGLLAALVVANATLFLLLRCGGPLIGFAFYGVLLALVWRGRQRVYRTVMVASLVGLAVHAVEVVTLGWSAFPLLMALNLLLPAVLVLVAWLAGERARQDKGSD